MPWYKVIFTKGKSTFYDSRMVFAKNKTIAKTKFTKDWKRATGSTIRVVRVEKR